MHKKISLVLTFCFCLINSMTFCQEHNGEGEGLGKVRKVNGYDVYIYSEPLKQYEVVDKITATWNWESVDGRSTIEAIVRTLIRNAEKRDKKNEKNTGEKADAIIVNDNYSGVLIRYLN